MSLRKTNLVLGFTLMETLNRISPLLAYAGSRSWLRCRTVLYSLSPMKVPMGRAPTCPALVHHKAGRIENDTYFCGGKNETSIYDLCHASNCNCRVWRSFGATRTWQIGRA